MAHENSRSDHCIGSTVSIAVGSSPGAPVTWHELTDNHRKHGERQEHDDRGR